MAALDPIQKAVREGKLRRLLENVDAQVHEELGPAAEYVLLAVEPGAAAGERSITVLSGVEQDQLAKVLGQALRTVRGDG